QTGQVSRLGTSGSSTLSVVVTDTDFFIPVGNPKTMRTSASDTFIFTNAGNSRTFQSGMDPGNPPATLGLPSPLLAFVPPVGIGPFSTSNPGVDTLLGVQPTPYSLTNVTVITMGPNTSITRQQTDQFAGTTVVQAVPEPATMMLAAM